MENDKIKCPKCGEEASTFGHASCFCDLDNCFGQRCMADSIPGYYTCSHCGSEGATPEAMAYYERHCRD